MRNTHFQALPLSILNAADAALYELRLARSTPTGRHISTIFLIFHAACMTALYSSNVLDFPMTWLHWSLWLLGLLALPCAGLLMRVTRVAIVALVIMSTASLANTLVFIRFFRVEDAWLMRTVLGISSVMIVVLLLSFVSVAAGLAGFALRDWCHARRIRKS
jgi:hypothetical protein